MSLLVELVWYIAIENLGPKAAEIGCNQALSVAKSKFGKLCGTQ
jgi:hypothetical protein